MAKQTFTYTPIRPDQLSATDLREELTYYDAADAEAYTITIYDEHGMNPHAEAAQALYLPNEGRMGIAWGADASWADVNDVESGIEMWLNDGDAWIALN